MFATETLAHPSPPELMRARSVARQRLDEALRRLGPAALDREAVRAIVVGVLHPKGEDRERS